MTDEPKPRTKRMQTQTERDLTGLERMRKEREDKRKPKQVSDSIPRGIAREQLDDLEEEGESNGSVSEEVFDEDTGITQRIADDPDLNRIFTKIEHERRRRANQIALAMGDRPPAEVLQSFGKTIKWMKWVVTAVAIPVVTSTVLVVKLIVSRTEASVRQDIEHAELVESVKVHKTKIEEMTKTVRDLEELARLSSKRLDDLMRARRGGNAQDQNQ